MRQIILILTTFFSLCIDGQISPIAPPNVSSVYNSNINVARNDTSLKILFQNDLESKQEPAYYLNGKHISSSILHSINPKVITDIKLERNDIVINSKKYYGQIFITTNRDYKFNVVTLTDLELKYAKFMDAPTLFMINNQLINEDYDKFILDQNYLLRINIETIENPKENLRFNLIRILTKTQENIKKVNPRRFILNKLIK